MSSQIIIHADDIGASKGVTDSVLSCVSHGALNSVSVLATGTAFEYSMEQLKKHPDVRVSVHLDFLEGKALTASEKIPWLVDDRGYFKQTFGSMLLSYYLAFPSKRKSLRAQVTNEIRSQVRLMKEKKRDDWNVALDGHRHTHMIPWVFDAIVGLKDELGISYIRTISEPVYFPPLKMGVLSYVSGFVKHIVLRVFTMLNNNRLLRSRIGHPDAFIGVIATGHMNLGAVESGLAALHGKSKPRLVEILFHPGRANAQEVDQWDASKSWAKEWYTDNNRAKEARALQEKGMKQLISDFLNDQFVPRSFPARLSAQFNQLFRFLVTGTVAAFTHLGLLYVFTDLFGIWYVFSSAVAFLVAFGVSFFLQKFWTFRENSQNMIGTQALQYFGLQIFNLTLNLAGVYVLVEFLHVWYLLAQFLILLGVAVLTYFMSRFIIFATVRPQTI